MIHCCSGIKDTPGSKQDPYQPNVYDAPVDDVPAAAAAAFSVYSQKMSPQPPPLPPPVHETSLSWLTAKFCLTRSNYFDWARGLAGWSFVKCFFFSSEDNRGPRHVRFLYYWQALMPLFCSARLRVEVCDEKKKKWWLEAFSNFLISIPRKKKKTITVADFKFLSGCFHWTRSRPFVLIRVKAAPGLIIYFLPDPNSGASESNMLSGCGVKTHSVMLRCEVGRN